MKKDDPYFVGPIGGLGGKAANNLAKKTAIILEYAWPIWGFADG